MFHRTKNINLSIIKEMEIRASSCSDCVSLAQGIPDADTPDLIKKSAISALNSGLVAKYSLSPGMIELRKEIQKTLAKEKMDYDWEKEIIITAGTIEGISATLLTIAKEGDEIIIPNPTYTSYREVINLVGAKPRYVDLDPENNWAFDIDNFKQAISKKTKAIFYCNPNNPTGTVYNKKQLLDLANLAEEHNLFLISDEVYKDFVYNDEEFFSLAQVKSLRKRVIRLYGFSKAYAMTGWRVAFLHADEKLAQEILKVHDSLVTCAPVVSQYAALSALQKAQKNIQNFKQEYLKKRDLICARADELKNYMTYTRPEGAYYLFPKIKNLKNSYEFSLDLLEKAKVAVVPGSAFGKSGEGHIRLNFSRSERDINLAFDRLEKYFKI